MPCHWKHHGVCQRFNWNSGARNASAAQRLPCTVQYTCKSKGAPKLTLALTTFRCIDCLSHCEERHPLYFLLSAFLSLATTDNNVFSEIVLSAKASHLLPRWSSLCSHDTDSYCSWVLMSVTKRIFEYSCSWQHYAVHSITTGWCIWRNHSATSNDWEPWLWGLDIVFQFYYLLDLQSSCNLIRVEAASTCCHWALQ